MHRRCMSWPWEKQQINNAKTKRVCRMEKNVNHFRFAFFYPIAHIPSTTQNIWKASSVDQTCRASAIHLSMCITSNLCHLIGVLRQTFFMTINYYQEKKMKLKHSGFFLYLLSIFVSLNKKDELIYIQHFWNFRHYPHFGWTSFRLVLQCRLRFKTFHKTTWI